MESNTPYSSAIGIIIAEDEKSFVMRFKLILRKVGIPVQNFKDFADSEEAIAYYKEKQPEIVFLDLNIKGSPKNGLEILQELRTNLKSTAKVGIISTSDSTEEIEQCRALGGNFYIVKTGHITQFEKRMRLFKQMFIEENSNTFHLFGGDG